MKKQRIEEMLQDCLDGYEAGLTPEECLSAYNGDRAVLEPLLRQALSLRVAYASSPSEEFRLQTRNRLMFAAGHDVAQALASEPDPEYVAETRSRFLQAAGGNVQEALRDVPPPRLAFWMSARRRLLEAAAISAPRRRPRYALALRYGLSAAVVVIALAVATLAPFTGNSPQSADAQLAILEQQIAGLEQQTSSGQQVSTSVLLSVSKKLNEIAGTLDDEPAPERASRLEGLHARSELLQQAPLDQPGLASQSQAQLDQAAAKLQEFALAAQQTPTQVAVLTAPTETTGSPTPATSATPSATATAGPTATPSPDSPAVARRVAVPDDTTAGLTWEQISTNSISFLVPTTWRTINLAPGEDNTLIVTSKFIGIETAGAEPVIIVLSVTDGEATALIKGTSIPLRGRGPDGQTAAPDFLVGTLGDAGIALHNFVLSIKVTQ